VPRVVDVAFDLKSLAVLCLVEGPLGLAEAGKGGCRGRDGDG
jgi:hypothetical protein